MGHGWAVDWWSLGMVLYEMLTGLPPWYTKDQKLLFERILHAPLKLPSALSPSAAALADALLQRDPQRRLGSARGARDVKAHAFFASKMSSYTTKALPRVSCVFPTRICRIGP